MGCAPLVIKGLPAKEYFRQYRLNRPSTYQRKPNKRHYAGLWPRDMDEAERRAYRRWDGLFRAGKVSGVFPAGWSPPVKPPSICNRQKRNERARTYQMRRRRAAGRKTRQQRGEEKRIKFGTKGAYLNDARDMAAFERAHDLWWSKAARLVRPTPEWKLGALSNPALFMFCLAHVGRIDKRAKRAAWRKKARRNPNCRSFLVERIRRRISRSIKDGHGMKSGKSREIIGCDWQFLRNHIEAKFAPGMSWENYGYHGWHIDHIVPLCRFDLADPAHVKQAWHFTNLQPLWAADNYAKLDS